MVFGCRGERVSLASLNVDQERPGKDLGDVLWM